MALIEDGADYLQLGTACQPRLAFSVKAFALALYCTCVILGGSAGGIDSQLYHWFEELCIKAFLAYRREGERVSGRMNASQRPVKNEKEAAEYMVRKSYSSYSTKGYDQFQLLTNGIPY